MVTGQFARATDLQSARVCSNSAPRLPVPSSRLACGELKLATPALTQLTSLPGFLAPGPRLAAGSWLTSRTACARWPEMP